MIEKVVRIAKLSESDQTKEDLAFWLSKTPEERIAAVEHLRRQRHGSLPRLQRSIQIIQRSRG